MGWAVIDALWIVALASAYSVGVGVAWTLLNGRTTIDDSAVLMAAAFLWPLSISTFIGSVITRRIAHAFVVRSNRRRERAARLPKAEVRKP